MAQIRLSIGERLNVSESYQEIKEKIDQTCGKFVELTDLVTVTDSERNDITIKEPVSIHIDHIVDYY